MSNETIPTQREDKKPNVNIQNKSSDTVYGLGLIGAWVYYIGRATTAQDKVKGFFKGFIWPAVFVYEMLKFLNKE
jgi:hypothetical protein